MSLFRNETVYTPNIVGIQDGSAAKTGSIGEVINATVAVGAAVALTTATPANVTSITLTPGDWGLSAQLNFVGTGATTAAGGLFVGGINTVTATVPTDGTEAQLAVPAVTTTAFKAGTALQQRGINVATTTTVYLVAEATFSAGTVGAYGQLKARRLR